MQTRTLTRQPVRLAEEEPAAAVRDSHLDSVSPGQTYRTIMFSDIEGFAAMTERLGDRRALETLHTHNVIVREQGAAYGGFEVKSIGDGFMAAFSNAAGALHCAISIQRAFTTYNRGHPEEPIRVRIGIHTGEVIEEAGDFFGKNVILAARIANEARGSQILVSPAAEGAHREGWRVHIRLRA